MKKKKVKDLKVGDVFNCKDENYVCLSRIFADKVYITCVTKSNFEIDYFEDIVVVTASSESMIQVNGKYQFTTSTVRLD